jgi:hypothetical protein
MIASVLTPLTVRGYGTDLRVEGMHSVSLRTGGSVSE